MYGFFWLPFLLIFNFERLLYASNVRLTFPYNAWLGTTSMCFNVGNEFHMDAWCLSVMHACYVCWLTFDVARGQGP